MHCHAGQGRTGIICAAFLFYAGFAASADSAIMLFKQQRLSSGALKRKRDQNCVREFVSFLQSRRLLMYPAFKKISDLNPPEVTHPTFHKSKQSLVKEEYLDDSRNDKSSPTKVINMSAVDSSA